MSTEKPLEGEINIELAMRCVKYLEEYLNKGIKSGAYDMKEVHDMYEYYAGVTETVKHCDLLQKKLKHLLRQQELLRQAETVTPKQV